MNGKSFALLVAATLLVTCAGGAIALKPHDSEEQAYEEVLMFGEICQVPRISGYNERIGEFLVRFANDNGLPCQQDSIGNVMIDHPGAIPRYVILQTHMDMVGVTEPGFVHDFTKDPISFRIVDGCISALHTSLGADDGVGMAVALCALKSPELSDYGFRCIFTIDEETDMKGAKSLSADWLEGFRYMVNIDNDVENQVLHGSAGYHIFEIGHDYATIKPGNDTYGFYVHGLAGGHSGLCIDMNRANAIILSMEFLSGLNDVQLCCIEGGQAVNAIPDSCLVVFTCSDGEATLKRRCQASVDEWNSKYSDRTITAEVGKIGDYETALSTEDSKELIHRMLESPNGLKKKEGGILITSSNIGVTTFKNGELRINLSCRSMLEEDLTAYHERFVEIFGESDVKTISSIPPWYGDAGSYLCNIAMASYRTVIGTDAELAVVHGGLETSIFSSMAPDMEMISIGPTLYDSHSTAERVTIGSMHILKQVVFDLIKNLR